MSASGTKWTLSGPMSAMSEKRKFDVKKLRSIVVDDDKGNRTNQRISTSYHDDKS